MNGKILCRFMGLALVIMLAYSVSADVQITDIKFSSYSPTTIINVTLKNTDTSNDVEINLNLTDLSNEDKYRTIGEISGTTLYSNQTRSFVFGSRWSSSSVYSDYSLNSYWNPYRCGNHDIRAKVWFSGTTRTMTKTLNINLENLRIQTIPSENISLRDNVRIKVTDIDNRPIYDLDVKIKFEDSDYSPITRTTNRYGEITFRPSYDFSPSSIGLYEITASKHERINDIYYCETVKEIEIKKKLKIETITPQKPKIGETITMTISTDNYDYSGVYLWIEGPEMKNFPVSTATTYFTLSKPGTYKISLLKDSTYWNAQTTISVEQNPELNIIVPDQVITGSTIALTTTNKDNLRISGTSITIEDPSGTKVKITTDWEGKIMYEVKKPGTYKLTAEKEGYTTTSATFTALNNLTMVISPENPKISDSVEIMLLDKNENPVDGTIYIDNIPITTTNGKITYTFTKSKEYEIKTNLSNYIKTERTLTPLKVIKITLSKRNLNVGEEITITAEGDGLYNPLITVTNTDTAKTSSVSSATYTLKIDSPGNYSVSAKKSGFGDGNDNFFANYLPLEVKYNYEEKLIINITSGGVPVEDVKITLIRPDNSYVYSRTNPKGVSTFEIEKNGNYEIIAEKTSYEKKDITINVKKSSDLLTIIIALIVIISVAAVLLYVFYFRKAKPKENT